PSGTSEKCRFRCKSRCWSRGRLIPLLSGDSLWRRAMMGRLKRNQGQFFYSFCLDEVVPDDHRVREIADVLDLSWVYAELARYYSQLGRPSIDPVLIIRMLIVGYVFAIRSERLLCREVQVNLAYVKFGIIMDVEASRAIRQAEVGAAKTMIDRTEER